MRPLRAILPAAAVVLILTGPLRAGWRLTAIPAAPMKTARARHAAAVLADGRVLVTGGLEVRMLPLPGAFVHRSGEVYDPARDAWEPLPATMNSPRWDHVCVTLPDGRVLLAGGKTTISGKTGQATKSTELFDPETGDFSPGPNMNVPRADFTATVLDDGRVLLAGGRSAQVFDPATSTFTMAVTLRVSRSAHRAVAIGGGQVLLIGGEGPRAGRSVELVDVVARKSKLLSARPALGVNDHSAAMLDDGRVLLAVGQTNGGQTTDTVCILQTDAGWQTDSRGEALAQKLPYRGGCSDMACEALGPLVILAGGEADNNKGDTICPKAFLFDARANRFVASTTTVTPHDDLAWCALAPGAGGFDRMMLIGGLAPEPSFGEVPHYACEILILLPDDAPPAPGTIARIGLGASLPRTPWQSAGNALRTGVKECCGEAYLRQ